jgi:hypothetical protein
MDGFRFFGYALGHHYIFGEHKPGRTDVWASFVAVRDALPEEGANRGIGTPDEVRRHLRGFAESGVDQVAFIQQGGRNRHEHICEALELFARDVMPEFKEHEEERERRKAEELAPYVDKAMARKQRMRALSDDEIPTVVALGRQIIAQATDEERERIKEFERTTNVPLEDPKAASRG